MKNHKQRNQDELDSPNGFLAGLLLGSLAGAGTMLFLAPQSGQKTRTQVWQKGSDWREQTSDTLHHGVEQVRAEIDQVATNLQKQVE
ncbi:MAG TPA: YtxH domain-containing protein [Anaerolineae bacterium]|nr:YtxH domain-containing protein [Anaerolineae bacterium]